MAAKYCFLILVCLIVCANAQAVAVSKPSKTKLPSKPAYRTYVVFSSSITNNTAAYEVYGGDVYALDPVTLKPVYTASGNLSAPIFHSDGICQITRINATAIFCLFANPLTTPTDPNSVVDQFTTMGTYDFSIIKNQFAITGGTGKFLGAKGVNLMTAPPRSQYVFRDSALELISDLYFL